MAIVKNRTGAFVAAALALMTQAAAAQDFAIAFEWGDIPLCTTGNPNQVPSPEFKVSGLPDGTKFIEFVLVDLDVPEFDHGGGVVELAADGVVPKGAFEYLSPCPPSGQHEYEWQAYALAENSAEAETLAEAFAARLYPE